MVICSLSRIVMLLLFIHKKEGVFKKINITGIPISDIVNFFIDGNNRMWVVMKGYNRCYDIQQEAASGDITLLPQKTKPDLSDFLDLLFQLTSNLFIT